MSKKGLNREYNPREMRFFHFFPLAKISSLKVIVNIFLEFVFDELRSLSTTVDDGATLLSAIFLKLEVSTAEQESSMAEIGDKNQRWKACKIISNE